MEAITIECLLFPSVEKDGKYLAYSSYGVTGQGGPDFGSMEELERELPKEANIEDYEHFVYPRDPVRSAMMSVESCVVNYLSTFAESGEDLPKPDRNIIDLMKKHCYSLLEHEGLSEYLKYAPVSIRTTKHRTTVREPQHGLPELRFEYHILEKSRLGKLIDISLAVKDKVSSYRREAA
jgi:hypothetical protein